MQKACWQCLYWLYDFWFYASEIYLKNNQIMQKCKKCKKKGKKRKKILKNAKKAKNEKQKCKKMKKNCKLVLLGWVYNFVLEFGSSLIGEVRCGLLLFCCCWGKQSQLLLRPTKVGLGLQVLSWVCKYYLRLRINGKNLRN